MILVLDLGSSSTRASIYDSNANPIDDLSARVPTTFVIDEVGRNEDDAVAAFDRVAAALDTLHAIAVKHASLVISDLGLSSYASSLICLEARGAPLTPVFTYADTRCAEDAHRLREQLDEMEALQRTGCRIRANYVPAKIAWIKRTQPDVFAQTRTFASLSDYVMLRLFGQMRSGISVASWSGLLSRETANWDETWLAALGLTKAQFPTISRDGEMLDGLLPQWRARWPQFAQVRCHPPIGDGAGANLGSGCIDSSRIAVTIGTTAAMRVARPLGKLSSGEGELLAHLPSSLWNYRITHAHDLIGGATTEGGNVFAWARRALQVPNDNTLETQLAAMRPDAHGLTVLPMFAGERSPGYAEDIRGTLHGLSLDTSPLDIARALIESISYRLAHICDALHASGMARDDATLVGSGGALLASPTWCQIIADVCGRPLSIADVPEATSRGVALLAVGQGLIQTSQPTFDIPSITYQPDPQHSSTYRAGMLRQQELYAKLI